VLQGGKQQQQQQQKSLPRDRVEFQQLVSWYMLQ
jgi:hypothetical protein